MPKRKTRVSYSLTLRQPTIPLRRKPSRSTRRNVVGKPSLTLPGAKQSTTTNPLAECKIEGCREVTTVGPLCLTHWEEKVMRRQSQPRPVTTGPNPSPVRRRWLVITAPAPSTGYIQPVWLELPL